MSSIKRYIELLISARLSKATRWHAKKPEKVTLFPKMSIDNSAASLKRARVIKLVIYILSCIKKKHPFTSHPVAKRPKYSKLAVTDM